MYKLLDAFCCAGGAGKGYAKAGFEVTGIDIQDQPNYPFQFIQGDAVEYIREHGHEYDVIHASPPCHFITSVQMLAIARNGKYKKTENLIPSTREAITQTGKPYIIENVMMAKSILINPVMLCGTYFDLKVYRHRLFECNFPVSVPDHHSHHDSTPHAGWGKSPKGFITVTGTGGVKGMTEPEILDYWRMAMGIDWMTRKELTQAIPPAYTHYIGVQLLGHLKGRIK